MSHPFGTLFRGAREAGFADGLQAGRQEVEKELVDLRSYVKQLEVQLHKEGNWRVARVTRMRGKDHIGQRGDMMRSSANIRKQPVEPQHIRGCTSGHSAGGVVKSPLPVPVPSPICSANSRDLNNLHYGHSNPWGSISRRRGRHFRSRTCTSQSSFRSQDTYIRYTIPPLRPRFVTDLVSSSLSFPTRLFSHFFDRDEGVAMREGGTWGSGSEVSGILERCRGSWFR